MKTIARHQSSVNGSHYERNGFHGFNLFSSQKLNAFSYCIYSLFLFKMALKKIFLTHVTFHPFRRYLFCYFFLSPFPLFILKMAILCPLSAAREGSLYACLMRKSSQGSWWQSHPFTTTGLLYLVTKTLGCVCSTCVPLMATFRTLLT